MVAEVLIVDDDDSLLRLMKRILSRSNIQASTARSVEEALEQLREKKSAVVMTDWNLARGSAQPLLEHLRGAHPRPIIIVVTGAETPPLQEFAEMISIVVRKPYDALLLGELVANSLASMHPASMTGTGRERSL